MVLASLVLASQTFVVPHNEYQWERLAGTISNLSLVAMSVIVLAALLRRYLPKTPMFGQMVLIPPSGKESHDLAEREQMVDFRSLLGEHGAATTRLTPAGRARFGLQDIDVITHGEHIDRGQAVVVVQVLGNRVVVRAAENR